MGAKSKAEKHGLVELIVDKWDGGKNTIVYVTEEVNEEIQKRGLKISISREGIRRVIKSHKEEIEDYKKALDMAKSISEVLQDNPGTEMAEGVLMQLTMLLQKEIRNIDGIEFEDPEKLYSAAAKIANAHERLSSYRTKATQALNKAKKEIKAELQNEIKGDSDLLERLCTIVDKVEVK